MEILEEDEEKYKIWQEEYDYIEWERFRDRYIKCSTCGDYVEGVCICYAR